MYPRRLTAPAGREARAPTLVRKVVNAVTLHKGWYSRGYLPHFDQPGLVQAITFRLGDSIPTERRELWQEILAQKNPTQKRAKIQALLDAGYGSCALRHPLIGQMVEDTLLYYDSKDYRLLAWVVMPNHVHALIETLPGTPLATIIRRWKSQTAREANRILGHRGRFWCADYYDRYIRDSEHLLRAVLYIHGNPVKAGLVDRAEEWPFSSARWLDALDATFHTPWEGDL